MEVYQCGTNVETKSGKIRAIITGITIRFNAVAYEISYFDSERKYTQIWLNEIEFDAKNDKRQGIGFKNYLDTI